MRKLVNLLIRKEELNHKTFVDYWLTEHAPLAESLPGIRKYTTSVPAAPEKSAYDGIAELYLAAGMSVGDVFATEAGERLQADAQTFLNTDAGELLIVDESVQFTTDEQSDTDSYLSDNS